VEEEVKEETKVLFGIVPLNNTSVFVCKSKKGRHYYKNKHYVNEERLVFNNDENAQHYIEQYLGDKVYKTELFIYNENEGIPFKIITENI
jgi:hypothetical protein